MTLSYCVFAILENVIQLPEEYLACIPISNTHFEKDKEQENSMGTVLIAWDQKTGVELMVTTHGSQNMWGEEHPRKFEISVHRISS